MKASGCYSVVFRVRVPLRLAIGKLGELDFATGYYAYVGSARSGLESRLARHRSRKKRMHWHIDYLSLEADFVKAYSFVTDQHIECSLARWVLERSDWQVAKFGCSDCRCDSHLFAFESLERCDLAHSEFEWQT
jgi:sugar fermentation stimulation protein A